MGDRVYDPTKRFKVPTYVGEDGEPHTCRLYHDLQQAILWDKWMFIVIWGEQRCGKSTLALWCVYFLWRLIDPNLSEEELWQRVYDSCVFNLAQVMYKIKDQRVARVWDLKHNHYRIPILLWDDFGAHSNKAVTQHDLAWDHFKGGFDILGTKVGIIIVTMTTPEQPTSQIEHKYTHEVVVPERGKYKYDIVVWMQNYKGWQAKHGKDWQQDEKFGEIPYLRFKPYDEMRVSLADEILEVIDDAMAQKIPWIVKRLNEEDIGLLNYIKINGPLGYQTQYRNQHEQAILRLKARQLIVPMRQEGNARNSHFDITNLGLDVLEHLEATDEDNE